MHSNLRITMLIVRSYRERLSASLWRHGSSAPLARHHESSSAVSVVLARQKLLGSRLSAAYSISLVFARPHCQSLWKSTLGRIGWPPWRKGSRITRRRGRYLHANDRDSWRHTVLDATRSPVVRFTLGPLEGKAGSERVNFEKKQQNACKQDHRGTCDTATDGFRIADDIILFHHASALSSYD